MILNNSALTSSIFNSQAQVAVGELQVDEWTKCL